VLVDKTKKSKTTEREREGDKRGHGQKKKKKKKEDATTNAQGTTNRTRVDGVRLRLRGCFIDHKKKKRILYLLLGFFVIDCAWPHVCVLTHVNDALGL